MRFCRFFLIVTCLFLFGCGTEKSLQTSTAQTVVYAEKTININTATPDELEKLPNIGEKLALKIVEHREKFGKFRRAEHLMLVRGVSDRRFREMRNLVKVE